MKRIIVALARLNELSINNEMCFSCREMKIMICIIYYLQSSLQIFIFK